MTILALLANSTLFKGVDTSLLETTVDGMTSKQVNRDEYVYFKGGQPLGIYFLEKGKVGFVKTDEDGSEQFIGLVSDGHFFGENEVLATRPCFADAKAMELSQLYLLPTSDFMQLFNTVPLVAQNLSRALAYNILFFQNLALSSQKLSLNYRLVNLLIQLLTRFGEGAEDTTLIDMKLTHEELALMVNSTRQSVAKALKYWQQQGWVDHRYGKVSILNKQALLAYRDSL